MRDVPTALQQLKITCGHGKAIVLGQRFECMLMFSIDPTGPKSLSQSKVVSVRASFFRHLCELLSSCMRYTYISIHSHTHMSREMLADLVLSHTIAFK